MAYWTARRNSPMTYQIYWFVCSYNISAATFNTNDCTFILRIFRWLINIDVAHNVPKQQIFVRERDRLPVFLFIFTKLLCIQTKQLQQEYLGKPDFVITHLVITYNHII